MRLVPELVPKTAWFVNLRSALPAVKWDELRRKTYAKAGHRCEVCGASGMLHAHEVWEYDDKAGVQRLAGLVALCEACHEVKHIGLAQLNGRMGEALAHMAKVNGCARRQAEKEVEEAFGEWHRRSKVAWRQDLSAVGIRKEMR